MQHALPHVCAGARKMMNYRPVFLIEPRLISSHIIIISDLLLLLLSPAFISRRISISGFHRVPGAPQESRFSEGGGERTCSPKTNTYTGSWKTSQFGKLFEQAGAHTLTNSHFSAPWGMKSQAAEGNLTSRSPATHGREK